MGSSRVKFLLDFSLYDEVIDIYRSLLWEKSSRYNWIPQKLKKVDVRVRPWSPYTHNEAWHKYHLMREYYNESDIWDDCMKLYHAYRARVQRARSRIFDIAQEDSVFLTLTFTDDVLASSDAFDRRDWVRRRLKSVSDFYIANIDFGSETEREHYHSVLRLPFWDTSDTSLWPYGFTKAEHVRCSGCADDPKSFETLSEYVSKLALHSLKESTKLSRIIYSRNGKTKITDFQAGRQEDSASTS